MLPPLTRCALPPVTQSQSMSKTAYALNLIDLCFTLYALSHGATELNPLMQCVPIMVAYKVIIVGVLLWSIRQYQWAVRLCATVYAVVNVWHIYNVFGR